MALPFQPHQGSLVFGHLSQCPINAAPFWCPQLPPHASEVTARLWGHLPIQQERKSSGLPWASFSLVSSTGGSPVSCVSRFPTGVKHQAPLLSGTPYLNCLSSRAPHPCSSAEKGRALFPGQNTPQGMTTPLPPKEELLLLLGGRNRAESKIWAFQNMPCYGFKNWCLNSAHPPGRFTCLGCSAI